MINYVLTKDCTGYSYLISPPVQASNRGLFIFKNIDVSIFRAYNINIQISKVVIMRRKTNEQFKQEVYSLVGDEYTFLDEYINTNTKLRVKHNTCGHIYNVTPAKFLFGRRCPHCNGNHKKTDAEFKQQVYDLVNNEYMFIDSYQGANNKIKVKHNKCGHIYEVTPSNFLRGSRCPFCYQNSKPKSDNYFRQEVKTIVGDEYKFLDTYVDAEVKLRVKHEKCGNIYKVRPRVFLEGYRCSYCKEPKGEIIIAKILDMFAIHYEAQKTFSDLKDKDYLSYDFYIPDQAILIEYQGRQHYQSIEYFGGDKRFKYQKKHDKMKSDYAKTNNYNLITIPYTEDTLSKIKRYLVRHGLAS